MKNFKLEVTKHACEILKIRLTATNEDGTISEEMLDMSGNATSALHYGAILVVDALNKMQKEFDEKPGDPDYNEPCPTCGH